jgi:NAD(P)-dependent dehydrogenase (short-subunit alcohol dehydrogenase family)
LVQKWSQRVSVAVVTGAVQGMGRACATQVLNLVDMVLLVDLDEPGLAVARDELMSLSGETSVESFPLDVTDRQGILRLASRVRELGALRAVVHAAGISPTMADWKRVFEVDLVGTALITDAIWPLVVPGTAVVCFASMAPLLFPSDIDPTLDAVLDHPLEEPFLERIREVAGPEVEDPGMAYMWAKRGVQRLVRREAVRFGKVGGRICSVSPGIIDTPMGRREAAARPTNDLLVQYTPLGREGRPEEVAAVAAFLLSDDAGFINGIDVLVDGGVVAAITQASLSE